MADIELPGIIANDDGVAQETMGLDAAPKWRPELAPSVAISTGAGAAMASFSRCAFQAA
jgi:hypothetical protein